MMGNKSENLKKLKPVTAVVNVEPVSSMLDKYYSSYSSYTPEQQINSMIIADSCVKQILENARNGYNEKFMAETKKLPVIKPSDFELLQFVLNYRTNGSGSRVIAADNIQGQRELLLKHSKRIGVTYATKKLNEPAEKKANEKTAQKSDKHRQPGASESILEPLVTPSRQAKNTHSRDMYEYSTGIDKHLASVPSAAVARAQTEMKEKEAKVGAGAAEKSDKLQCGASDSILSGPGPDKKISNPETAEDGFDLQASLKNIERARVYLRINEAAFKFSAKMCNDFQSIIDKIHQRAVGNSAHAKFKEYLNSEFEGDPFLKVKASVYWVWNTLKEKAAQKSAKIQPSVADNIVKRGVGDSAHIEYKDSKTDGHAGDQSFSKLMTDVDRDWNIMKEKEAREQALPLIPPESIDKAEMQSIPIEDVQKAEKFQSGIVDAILNCVYGDPDSTKHKERSNSESDKKHEAVAAQKPDKPHCETDSLFEYVMGDSDSTKKDSVRPRSEIDDSISKKANEMLAAVAAREKKKEKEAREKLLSLIPPEDKAENPSLQSIPTTACEWEKFSENDSDRPIVNESDDTVHVQAVSNSTPNVDRALKEWKKLKLLAAAQKADKLQAIIDEALQCPDSANMKYKELMNLQTGGAIGDHLASNAVVNSVYNELKEAVQKCDKLQAEINKYEKLLNAEIYDGIDKRATSNPVAAVAREQTEMKEKEAKVGAAAAAEKCDKLQSGAPDSSILEPLLKGLNSKLLNSGINDSDVQAILTIGDHVWRNLKEKEASFEDAIQKFEKFHSAVDKMLQRGDGDPALIKCQEISNIDGNVDVQAISSPTAGVARICNERKDPKDNRKFVKLEALVAKLLKRAGGDDSGHINYKELLNSEIDGDVSGNHLCLNPTAAADHDNSKMNDVINEASQKLDKLQSEIDSLHDSVEKDFAKYDKLPCSESDGDGIDESAVSMLVGAVACDDNDKEKEKEAREELLPLIPPEEEAENSSMQMNAAMIAEMEKMWDTDFFRTFFCLYRAGFRTAFKELNHRFPEENEIPNRYYISQSVNLYNGHYSIQSEDQFIRLAPSLGELLALELAKKKYYSSDDDIFEDARE